ncbi:MAG: Holliday junction resolvase RuvX [Burkholderiaceae bacterium]|jgi:putative Holliday junction resolvase
MTERIVLGFDFGVERIGVALGNTLTRTARPLETIARPDNRGRFERIAALIAEWSAQQLVVGIPRHPDGAEHDMTKRCERFACQLEGRTGLPVARADERYSSVEAARSLPRGQTGGLDAQAAAVILEQYLSSCPKASS